MRIETCEFKREKDSPWEPGLLFNEGDIGIMDTSGKFVPKVWTWERECSFAVELEPIFKYMKEQLGEVKEFTEQREATMNGTADTGTDGANQQAP